MTKKFFIYILRWIISAFVMMPFMIFFEFLGMDLVPNLLLGQIIGACIFFKIDKYIFTCIK